MFFVDNLLVRVHLITVMMRWTGLAPWEFEFPSPGSLTSTFLYRCWSTLATAPRNAVQGYLAHKKPRPAQEPLWVAAGRKGTANGFLQNGQNQVRILDITGSFIPFSFDSGQGKGPRERSTKHFEETHRPCTSRALPRVENCPTSSSPNRSLVRTAGLVMHSKRHLPDIEQWSRAVAPTSSRGGLVLA